ncbi:alpha/beta-hydrolase [Backusella circina FSU 941]|nr:alpha/beta-hydrolase [Backusella circina FSU 941]
MLRTNHLFSWRAFLSLAPVKPLRDVKSASFKVSKGTHNGIFQKCSEGEDGARKIEADWLSYTNPANKEKIMYYIHGGGFTLFDKRCFNSLCLKIRETFQRRVFAIKYRLAPESHFPGPIFDAFKGYLYLINDRNINPKNITICGDSAGGNLSLSLLFYLREHGYPLPGACILLSPWIDMSYSYPSWIEFTKFDYLPERPTFDHSTMNPSRCYLGRENYYALTQHPYASLQYIHDFENMPPMLIQSGGCEVLVDEIRAFASKLENSKTTRVTYEEYEDMFHVFQSFPIRKADQAFESMKEWLEREELSKE